MDTLLTAIPAIALGTKISAIPAASLLSGTIVTGSARTAKAAPGSTASTTTKTASAETSASGAATTEATWSATRTTASGEAWCLSRRSSITILASTRIVTKTTRTAPETWTEVAAWIAADLLQSPTQRSIQEEGFIGAVALYTCWNFWLSRGAADLLPLDLIGQFRRSGSLLIAWPASLLTWLLASLRPTLLTRCRWRSTAGKLRSSLTLSPRWPRSRSALTGSLLSLCLNRRSRPSERLQRETPFQIRRAGELHFFPRGIKPEHFYFKCPSAVGDAVQLILTLLVCDGDQRLVA